MAHTCWLRALLCTLVLYNAGAGPTTTTRNVFTYLKLLGSDGERQREQQALSLWNESWTRAGWSTAVLAPEDAQASPRYAAYLQAFTQLPTVNALDYELACYMRWVAMSLVAGEGAVMTDYDVLNAGWSAPQPVPARLTTLQTHVPSAVIGNASEYARAADYFAGFQMPAADSEEGRRFIDAQGRTHVSDMVLLAEALRLDLFNQSRLVYGFGESGSEAAQLVHYSHAAVQTNGGGRSRNDLMAAALAAGGGGSGGGGASGGGCSGRRAVLFSGQVRGDVQLWTHIRDQLVVPNGLDVMIDVWSSSAEQEAALRSIFEPCYFFSESDGDWKARAAAEDPAHFALASAPWLPNGTALYLRVGAAADWQGNWSHWVREGEGQYSGEALCCEGLHGTFVDAFYRLFHGIQVLQKFSHSLIVRARLDTYWPEGPPAIPAQDPPPNTLFIPSLGNAYEERCPLYAHDQSAYGDFLGMRTYLDVYPLLPSLIREMASMQREKPHELDHKRVGFFQEEAILGQRLWMSRVSCRMWNVHPPCMARPLKEGPNAGRWQCKDRSAAAHVMGGRCRRSRRRL